jgi:hypothetical protein
MADRMTLGQVFVEVLLFAPVRTIPLILHSHSFVTDIINSQQVTASLNRVLKHIHTQHLVIVNATNVSKFKISAL